MRELEEAIELEVEVRLEKEKETDDMREQLVEVCARISEADTRDEEIARRVLGSRAHALAEAARLKVSMLFVYHSYKKIQNDNIMQRLSLWRRASSDEACKLRENELEAERVIKRAMPSLHASMQMWVQTLNLLGLSRRDVTLRSGRLLHRPKVFLHNCFFHYM